LADSNLCELRGKNPPARVGGKAKDAGFGTEAVSSRGAIVLAFDPVDARRLESLATKADVAPQGADKRVVPKSQ
jgi:hypothetical protein